MSSNLHSLPAFILFQNHPDCMMVSSCQHDMSGQAAGATCRSGTRLHGSHPSKPWVGKQDLRLMHGMLQVCRELRAVDGREAQGSAAWNCSAGKHTDCAGYVAQHYQTKPGGSVPPQPVACSMMPSIVNENRKRSPVLVHMPKSSGFG